MGMKWVTRLLRVAAVFLVVVFIPGLPPEGNFTQNKITPPEPLEGKYKLNGYLNNADHLYVDKVRGPECFAEWKGELYTSVHGGEVIKLLPNDKIVHVTKIGQPCDGHWQEKKCGRPLGIRFDKSGNLHVVDAYYGIWKVNMETKKKQLLVSPHAEIEGRKPKLFNSIALASNGDFYWTESTSDVDLEDGVIGMLLDGSGRLFHYDAAKNKSRVLLEGLWFANGVVLSPNEDFVVVAETAKSQLRRYYLKGEKKGTDDIFIDGLPGLPDNLNADRNSILMPLVAPRDDAHPVIFQSIAPHPMIRKFLARLIALIELPFKFAQSVLPHYAFERCIHWIGHFESVQAIVPKRVGIVKLDWSGNVQYTWYNTDGTLSGISEAFIFKDNMYFGSPYNMYVGVKPFPRELYESAKYVEEKKEHKTVKTTEQATTAKPTETPTVTQTTKTSTTSKPVPSSTTKPTQSTTEAPKTTTPKKTQTTPKPTQTTATPKTHTTTTPSSQVPTTESKIPPKPIVEEIPQDTKPPHKENLKVIKKEGPTEIPIPESTTKKPKKNEL